MDAIRPIVKGVLSDLLKKQKKGDAEDARKAWRRIVGPQASRHTKVVHLSKEKIRVNVDSSAWLYDLNLKKDRIRRELSRSLKIKDVSMRLGDIS